MEKCITEEELLSLGFTKKVLVDKDEVKTLLFKKEAIYLVFEYINGNLVDIEIDIENFKTATISKEDVFHLDKALNKTT